MRLAIMQPYFFPYLGYWQLLNTADRFVIFDDVNYIKRGWINRNRILVNGEPKYITVPLNQSSQNKRICDLTLLSSTDWRKKLVRSIEYSYRKAPCFPEIFPIIEKIICHKALNLSEYLANQLVTLAELLRIDTEFVMSSRCYQNDSLTGPERILDICRRENATTYINPEGGYELYDTAAFESEDIDLRFLVMRPVAYKQRSTGFVPFLSIIDALMEVSWSLHLDEFDFLSSKRSYVQ